MNMTKQLSTSDLPNVDLSQLVPPDLCVLGAQAGGHAPRILLLYGSLRPQSYSRKLALEAER
jgi:arsenic resistance protein ArsH